MDFGGLVVATGLMSFLCLLTSMLFLFRWRYRINKADKSRIENKCDYERMDTLGFTVVNFQQDNNSLLEAVADQLIFSGVNKKATVKETQRKIYEYFQNVSTSYLVTAYRYLIAKAILVNPKNDDLLYAIANIYKVTIEVVNAGTLESRIIRPLHCKLSTRQQIKGLFIGYTRNSRFVSLRKLPEPKVTIDDLPAAGSITQSKERPLKIFHNDTVGNKTELDIANPRQTVISIGDNQTNVLDCGDVFEKLTTITVGTNNVQHIRCNLRTPKDVLKCAEHFYENKNGFVGAEIKLKITCKGDSTMNMHAYEKNDKQDQQGKAAFNERNPHMIQQQEPTARSPGGPQTKTGQGKDRARTGQHRKMRYFVHDELDYQEVGYMTGIIKGNNGLVATAFRAGHDFVLTTYHFVSATDQDQIEVLFKDEERGKKLKLIFFSRELDVALLEIQCPSKKAHSVLYITDASPGDDIYIVGHTSKNKLKKERTTCLNWRNINMSSDCEEYILFHSEKFREGSSGAPCVKIHDNKLCVVSILIGELIGTQNSRAAHLGVNMMALYNLMLKQDESLCHAIFQVVDNSVAILSERRTYLIP